MFEDLDRVLDEVYGDDERAKAAARADATAIIDHRTTDASDTYAMIARNVWAALRRLGIGGGTMLVLGQDPEIFAGLPRDERRLEPGALAGFTATVPLATAGTGLAPHPGLRLRQWDSESRVAHDVVIGVPEWSDVALHRPGAAAERRVEQVIGILGCLANTAKGGYAVTMVNSGVLDDLDHEGRRLIAELGELVGAVRLPAGALRENPGNDAVVDLLIWRRSFGLPVEGHPFLPAHPQQLNGHRVHINEYYLARPRQVLGRLTARTSPWGPPEMTVLPFTGLGLDRDVTAALDAIVQHACDVGLTAATDHSIDLDAPIGYQLTNRSEARAARERVTRLREQRRHREVGDPGRPSPAARPQRRDTDRPGM